MKILILYNSGQTFTQTVFEHLDALRKFSQHQWHYLHFTEIVNESENLKNYQAIFLHYSVRLPLDQINDSIAHLISSFNGIKGLFIQDEYDHTNRTKYWIRRIGFNLVFTVVPQKSVARIYPTPEFPNTKFVSVLTGYAPFELNSILSSYADIQTSKRRIVIGYRGRKLPIKYGALGVDKIRIGKDVKRYCKKHKIIHDIEWDEHSRIYGKKWYEFLLSCKAMLGSESGSNVFDWDGNLSEKIKAYKKINPIHNDEKIYESIIKPIEIDGLMNQVSPRIFEMAATFTVMILYEGSYSNVLEPNLHYLPLKRDLSNLPEIIALLHDNRFVDEMAQRAWRDIIRSEKYNYPSFVALVDNAIGALETPTQEFSNRMNSNIFTLITQMPTRGKSPILSDNTSWLLKRLAIFLYAIKDSLPLSIRTVIKNLLGRA